MVPAPLLPSSPRTPSRLAVWPSGREEGLWRKSSARGCEGRTGRESRRVGKCHRGPAPSAGSGTGSRAPGSWPWSDGTLRGRDPGSLHHPITTSLPVPKTIPAAFPKWCGFPCTMCSPPYPHFSPIPPGSLFLERPSGGTCSVGSWHRAVHTEAENS